MCRKPLCIGCTCSNNVPCGHCLEGHALDNLIEEIDEEEFLYRQQAKDFFFGKRELRSIYAEQNLQHGLCPICGEKGDYHLSVPCCRIHGPY